ncbi:hypothetical protein [Methanomethylophilus alvi]|uniref:hypothetical protein n=1 Tax=Methanomethylophilus alvi TaxID=1291540 RepID=UPI0037DC85E2
MAACCFCVPTPYSILNDPDDGEDVFETIFPNTDAYYTEKRLAMWNRYHDTGIGNCDKAYWERCVKARAAEIEGRYAIKFRVWQEYTARLAAATSVDLADSSIKSESVNSVYDPPEVNASGATADKYLADQNKTEFDQQTYGGLESETVRQYADAVENPFETWAAEFDRLFYWGL